MTNEHMNDNATPTLDGLFGLVVHALSPERRWMLEGWAAHLRAARHQNHAANSWAKHRDSFARVYDLAQAFTVARIVDFGEDPEAAAALLRERIVARAAKLAAEEREAAQRAAQPPPREPAPQPVQQALPLTVAAA